MCGRKAASQNKELPDQFWKKDKNNSEWNQYFVRQMRYAINLIKHYGEKIVLSSVDENRCIYSLANDQFEDFCSTKKRDWDLLSKTKPTEIIVPLMSANRFTNTKNKLNSL